MSGYRTHRRGLGLAIVVMVAASWLAMPALGLVVEQERTEYCCCGAEVEHCECPGCPGKPTAVEGHDSLLACSTAVQVDDVLAHAAPLELPVLELLPPDSWRPPPLPPPPRPADRQPPAYEPPPS
ncbi:MAG: hypothetical protein KJO07_18295 [Deltaproteobacteria bacterium]|nr:hypothetical protein [Deltaproteobacteria bacterium]